MTNFLNNLKNYFLIGLAAITAILTALFFYEKRKAEIGSAILGEQKVDADLAKDNVQIAANEALLKQQAADRAKLENEKNEEPTTDDITKRLNE
jgi:hypothetical protein